MQLAHYSWLVPNQKPPHLPLGGGGCLSQLLCLVAAATSGGHCPARRQGDAADAQLFLGLGGFAGRAFTLAARWRQRAALAPRS
jgi:hypothetical protein